MSAELRPVENSFETMMVPSNYCAMEWPHVYMLLMPAVERSNGRWTMQDLLLALCAGNQQLWITKRGGEVVAALTTQVVDYPSRRVLAIQFLGGDGFEDWSHSVLNLMERFALDAGCDGIEAVGRFGFWPFFKGRGYEKSYCTYERLIEDTDNG